MRTVKLSLSLLPLVAIMIAAHLLGLHVAEAATAAATGELAPGDLIAEAFRGITTGDWFLAAGAALSLTVMGARWGLARWWPSVTGDLWGVALTAGLAGFGALGHAWIADADPLGAETLLGAIKVWASAVFLYVTGKKLARPSSAAKAASVALLIALVVPGCKTLGESGVRTAANVIDCLKPNTKSLAGELLDTMSSVIRNAAGPDGKVDWTSVRAVVGTFKSDAPMCAFTAAVNEAIRLAVDASRAKADAPQSEGLELDPADLSAGYEAIRRDVFGGATFKLDAGGPL